MEEKFKIGIFSIARFPTGYEALFQGYIQKPFEREYPDGSMARIELPITLDEPWLFDDEKTAMRELANCSHGKWEVLKVLPESYVSRPFQISEFTPKVTTRISI